jgi:tetratricopeptide (TPR) repeat protein
MKQIAEAALKYYPDHVESLSNLSIVYLIKKDYDKSLEALLKAEKLSPADYIVLSNIAQAYKLKGNNKNAIKYYELTIKYGDEQAKKYAQEQIDELKKK